jgi:putative ubiquitin-RnfH superfamily antitoxin RatB of RatAB toxin-antitoxin module
LITRGREQRLRFRGVVVSRVGSRVAFLVVLGLLCLVAIYFLNRDRPAQDPASLASVAGGGQQPQEPPRVVIEDRGRIEIVRPVKVESLPPTIVEPLFEPGMRLPIGETAKLKFAARDRVSGLPVSGSIVTASVLQGAGPARPLPAEEVEDGVFEVPFTPRGPGQFQVSLNVDGVVAGSRRVGVVGAVGATDGKVDIVDPLSIDPRDPRARTAGRSRRR